MTEKTEEELLKDVPRFCKITSKSELWGKWFVLEDDLKEAIRQTKAECKEKFKEIIRNMPIHSIAESFDNIQTSYICKEELLQKADEEEKGK